MASITDKITLKSWFKKGLKPLEVQFHAWMDSYWHKSEQIPTASVEGLEKVLNHKAESSALDEISNNLEQHKQDDNRHKTPGEQEKLDHLADNPDLTYASKDEVMVVKPLLFTATIDTTTGKYILDDDQLIRFASYFEESQTNPVLLQCFDDSGVKEVYALMATDIDGFVHSMIFINIGVNIIKKLRLYASKSTSGIWGGFVLKDYLYNFGESEYKYDRYIPETSFDMNDFTEAGGISVLIIDSIIGTNIPEGFTNFYGYVLNNKGGGYTRSASCIQVVTDRVLKKTVFRTCMPTEDFREKEWTPWQKMGITPNEQNKLDNLADNPNEIYARKDELAAQGAIIIPMDFGDDNMVENIKAFVQPFIDNGDFYKKPVYANYIWKIDYTEGVEGGDRSAIFPGIAEEYRDEIGYGFNYPIEVMDSYDQYYKKYIFVCSKNGSTYVKVSSYSPQYDKTYFLFENGDGMISVGDRDTSSGIQPTLWDKFRETLVFGLTPTLYLKTNNTDIFIPASYTLTPISANSDIFYGHIRIEYMKDNKLCIENREFMRNASGGFVGFGSIYQLTIQEIPLSPEINIVTEYPTDLSSYPDGSIFIKQ